MPRTEPDIPASAPTRPLLDVLAGASTFRPPIWLMRQAGRYLPEYRALRAKAGSFLDLCYTPALAAEVTVQPIRRYAFDAAILFSDILVVPDALGQRLDFVEGEGPRLDPVRTTRDLARLALTNAAGKFQLVSETVARVRQNLPPETALIGFCGAPWTVATYMVEGRGSADQAQARAWSYRDPAGFGCLIDLLTEASIAYLDGQVQAGADALQIFDSWAGSLPDDEFEKRVVAPTARIVQALKRRHPNVPIIGFPRGAGSNRARYVKETAVDCLGCDTQTPLAAMKQLTKDQHCAVQGNLDPLVLVAGGQSMEGRIRKILETLRGTPFVFNLGHGIVPETPPENVARLVEIVRSVKA